ncbi:MAG: hypothetical protein KH614_06985, partial [Firmicutes bacterium]|nr:hypothetical protein [Bacillota bacterium]
SGWREIFRRVEVWKAQMYFVYLKLSRPMDRRKIPGIRRRGSRQSFPYLKGKEEYEADITLSEALSGQAARRNGAYCAVDAV